MSALIKTNLIPIFVVGAHRSGTTWVANALCNHSQIYGVQDKKYYGIVESWFFSHLDGRFGDLSCADNYQNLITTFVRTAFCQVSSVGIEQLKAFQPQTYAQFFEMFMACASAPFPETRYWLEKTPVHTLYLAQLIEYYPQAKFLAIKRSLPDVVRSSIKMKYKDSSSLQSPPLSLVTRLVLHWHKYNTFINHFKKRCPEKIIQLSYEQMVAETEQNLRHCLDFLELDWQITILDERFSRNTSFDDQGKKRQLVSNERLQNRIRMIHQLVKITPYQAYELQEVLRQPRNKKPIPFLTN